jgi:hypothetical protein
MIELIYYSISEIEITSKVLENILFSSRNFNSKNNITGCLLYHNKVFLQMLEGDKKAVNDLFNTIKKDKIHSNVTLIIKEPVKERMFPGWNMAYHELNNNETKVKQFIQNIAYYSENTDKETEAIDLFWRMAKQIVK